MKDAFGIKIPLYSLKYSNGGIRSERHCVCQSLG